MPINKSFNLFLTIFFFMFPLLYFPLTSDPSEFNKQYLLIIFSVLFSSVLLIRLNREKNSHLSLGTFGLPFILITVIYFISNFIQSPNPVLALITPLSTVTFLTGTLLYITLVNILSNDSVPDPRAHLSPAPKTATHFSMLSLLWEDDASDVAPQESRSQNLLLFDWPVNLIILDALIISIFLILIFNGVFTVNLISPAGSVIGSTLFIVASIIFIFTRIFSIFKKNRLFFFIYCLVFIVLGVSLGLTVPRLFSDQKPLILPFSAGWNIYIETLRNIKTLFLGIGPANFQTAYTLAKPAFLNYTVFWNLLPAASSSFVLTLATEVGTVAMILYLYLVIRLIKLIIFSYRHLENFSEKLPFFLVALFLLLAQIALPSSMAIFTLTIIFLALSSHEKPRIRTSILQNKIVFRLVLVLSIVITLPVIYFGYRFYLAEVNYMNSLNALLQNNGRMVYNYQLDATRFNPYQDRYRLSFSQTNLALANVLAGKKDLSDEDKKAIPRFIQQAIDEARSAVSLNRTSVNNWDNLANTYASLTNFATGAKDWAIKSHEQKLILDPLSPAHHFAFGRLYLNQKDYANAEKLFREAIALKNDFANAHYHLAMVLREEKKYQESYQELQTTRALVAKDSDDEKRILTEMDKISRLTDTKEVSPSSQLSPAASPQTLELPTISPNPLNFLPSLTPAAPVNE